ncbi:helix-turn-helix domain-containing protein [Pseudodesulfovibrio cashew]|uniref:Helix-turn-helix domain-containing protein n=1 Tax=Pseudodesulfovibrio cashew TaxID=2678688 RepID=A0A6I6JI63_9BACT|nr:AraC family transcriptional regulator [Pseudodesulfovibrio cashew]QGY39982.1 helix-turn-helix domain-containing protein [Pseudodesulfovibrio cashew]
MSKTQDSNDVRFWRDPDLPGVEFRYSSYNDEAFRKHTHPAYSIGLIEGGSTVFLLDGAEHAARAGQIALIGPGAVHACNPDSDQGLTYRMFYVDAEQLENVGTEVFGRRVTAPAFPDPVVDDPDLTATWLALFNAVAEGAGRLEKESLLFQALADLLLRHALLEPPKQEEKGDPTNADLAVQLAAVHLSAQLSEKVSLDELAERAHLSRYHLLRVFRERTGLPPHAYQTQLRVDMGKRLLAAGRSISEAAAEAGFVDQSHFTRVFKQHTGATPKQYQQAEETGN